MNVLKEEAARRAAKKSRGWARHRWKVQLLSFLALNSLAVKLIWGRALEAKDKPSGALCVPVLNCHGCPAAATYCPVGVIGDFLDKGLLPLLALGAIGLVGALCGRLTCGWACPFGALQDLIAKIPIPRPRLSARWLRPFKYAFLIGLVFLAPLVVGTSSRWFFCGICPDATILANGWKLAGGVPIPAERLLFLGLFLVLMLLIARGFCRLVCPLGAGLAPFNRISLVRLRVDRARCTNCGLCRRVCPMGEDPLRTDNPDGCIRCLKCQRCPEGLISLLPPRPAAPPPGPPAPEGPGRG